MSSNHIDFTGLRKWFGPKDITAFFGSRTQSEVNEAVQFFGKLPDSEVAKMRRYLAQLSGQQRAGRRSEVR